MRARQHTHSQAEEGEGARTKEDGVELGGALVDVGKEDAAGLEDSQELRLSGRRQRREEGVVRLGHLQL
jgi:hypothetical protein